MLPSQGIARSYGGCMIFLSDLSRVLLASRSYHGVTRYRRFTHFFIALSSLCSQMWRSYWMRPPQRCRVRAPLTAKTSANGRSLSFSFTRSSQCVIFACISLSVCDSSSFSSLQSTRQSTPFLLSKVSIHRSRSFFLEVVPIFTI